jgi:hypothetical protein
MNIKKMFSDKREFSRAAAMIVFVIMTAQTYSKIQESGVLDPFRLTIIGFGLVAFALGVLILGSFAETSEKVNLKVPVIKALVTIGLILLVVGSIGLVLAAALSLM